MTSKTITIVLNNHEQKTLENIPKLLENIPIHFKKQTENYLPSVGFEPTRTTVHLELNSWRLRPLGQLG